MSKHLVVEADSRERNGTSAVRRMRHEGLVPGVVYGAEEENANIKMDHNKILHALETEAFHSSILELKIDGKSEKVVLRDFQVHPASDVKIMHVDFQRVSRKEKLSMTVPLHFTGEEECDGLKIDGGLISHIMNELDVVCLPADLPEYIEVSIAKMRQGDTITLAELNMPEGVESQIVISGGDEHQAVVHLGAPQAAEAVEVEDVAAAPAEGAEEAAAEEGDSTEE